AYASCFAFGLSYGHESGGTAYCNVVSPKGKPVILFCGSIIFSMLVCTIVVFVFLQRKNQSLLQSNAMSTLTAR
ncbi:hypothetical protein PMAYCL1PPCAC_16714, partial [Pristionchus mayeri]